ncbi:MAG TPA: GNAT family N-acetyltransferase [Caulobacteraceae bacterium]|jgi:predicted acetyltransferase
MTDSGGRIGRATTVTVTKTGSTEQPLIEALTQFYIYDFSEMEPSVSPDFEFDDQGGFGRLPNIDDYWQAEGSHALLIRSAGRLAGFALINAQSHRGGPVERNMGEFFVARKHRRQGVATEAVHLVLRQYPGRWEVAVAERNVAAKAFWPRAIASAPKVSDIQRHEGDGVLWRGPIWSFLAS